jgi:hypothetical protein
MSSNASNQILSFTRPRSATPPHGNGPHPCTRPAAIEQAFGTKCWSFDVTIVDSPSHRLPWLPGELENHKGPSGVLYFSGRDQDFFRERRAAKVKRN